MTILDKVECAERPKNNFALNQTYSNCIIHFRIGSPKDRKQEIAEAVDIDDIEEACRALFDQDFIYSNVPSTVAAKEMLCTLLLAWRDSWRGTNTWSIKADPT